MARHSYSMRIYYNSGAFSWIHWVTYPISFGTGLRFPMLTPSRSETLHHIERILLGYESENGLVLYVNDEDVLIKTMATDILKYGRGCYLFTYHPASHDNEYHSPVGGKYPAFDKNRA
jgi:hypothetical protein